MILKASKIYLSNPEKTNSFIKCHHFFPSSHQRKLLGELLFLIEIKTTDNLTKKSLAIAEEISEIIVNGLRTNYYTPEALREKEVEENFENSLQKLNRLIYQEIIGSRSFEALVKNLNAVVGLLHEEKVYFSSVGSAQAFILKKNKIIDLVAEEVAFMPSRVFSQIISGNLEKEDCLFFSTANFLDYFVFEKLSQIVQKNNVEEAAQKLKELLKNLRDKISTGAILIKKEAGTVAEEVKEERPIKIPARKVMKKESTISVAKSEPLRIIVKPEPEEEKVEKIVVKEEKPAPAPQEKQEIILPKIEERVSPSKREQLKIRLRWPKISLTFLKKIHLPRLPRITLPKISLPRINLSRIKTGFIPIIILVILISSLVYTFVQNRVSQKQTANFFISLMDVKAKISLLSASLAYGDFKKVDVLVEEIKNKIVLLRPKTKTEKEIFGKIKNDFESLTDKIYNVRRTNQPEVFADLASVSRREGLKNMVRIANGNFIILNLANNTLYEFDFKNNKAVMLTKANIAFNKIINYNEKELLLASDNQIKIFNLETKKINQLKIETARKNFYISDLKIFDNKLYILDNKANQIFKYLKTESGFGNETTWFKDSVNLKDITSFALDGSIYLLKNSGELTKFFLGRKQPFSLDNIYPPLIKPTKVYTNEDMRNIYILEPLGKRVLIYNKSGKLQKQIFSEEFNDLKDFVIDERVNKLYLLNDAKIFTIDLKK